MHSRSDQIFVLDTNVLMHDPAALFRFHEHDVFLPMVVLEELDHAKKGITEVARNVRQVSRLIDELMHRSENQNIAKGLSLIFPGNKSSDTHSSGRLYIQTQAIVEDLPANLPGNVPDNQILGAALSLSHSAQYSRVTLVSKDINLRIKAAVTGINAEDYQSDQVLDDVNLLYSGMQALPADFWDKHDKDMDSWQSEGRTFYKLTGPLIPEWQPNLCLYTRDEHPFQAIVRKINGQQATIEMAVDYSHHKVWGIQALNPEQNFALNLLMDTDIDFVSLVGMAGSGKTLLALAAGMAQTLEDNNYREIIMTRVTVPVGEDIGFLPGTEEEKMTPWMGALMDNLEVLTHSDGSSDWGRTVTTDLVRNRIKIRSLNFMRGRTFLNRYIILDEAQNLTPKQIKTLVTRAGPGSKVVCIGNVSQIDTPYLTETTSGLTYAVDRFRPWQHSGHITLLRGERSRLADYASEEL